MVSTRFNHTVNNSYSLSGKLSFPLTWSESLRRNLTHFSIHKHIYEIAISKFVLCPSGLGMDTYRLWETLLLGSIPIVESNAGFNRVYSKLPVFVIPNYTDLTPALLEAAYPCFVKHLESFDYRLLLEKYWIDLLFTSIDRSSIEMMSRNHPPENPYCAFHQIRFDS